MMREENRITAHERTSGIPIFRARSFPELTTVELYELLRSRAEIFVGEQGILYPDPDGLDYRALHCFLWDGARAVACLRGFAEGDAVHIGRVLSLSHGIGLGTRLLRESIPVLARHFGVSRLVLHAQTHARRFYERLGFCAAGAEFEEAGVPHIAMERIL